MGPHHAGVLEPLVLSAPHRTDHQVADLIFIRQAVDGGGVLVDDGELFVEDRLREDIGDALGVGDWGCIILR